MKKYTIFLSLVTLVSGMLFSHSLYAVKHIVTVQDITFTPLTLSVLVGDTVRWVWVNGTHTTTSVTIPAGANTWDQPITGTNTFYEYPVTVLGTYDYECSIHGAMGMTATFTTTGFVPTLDVSPLSQNVSAGAGSTDFTVTSNSDWTTQSGNTWCIAQPPAGSGNGTMTVLFTENTSATPRTGHINVMVPGTLLSQWVMVIQAGAVPTLTVGPQNQNVPATPGNTTFSVVSNTTWTVSSNAAWCTVNPSGSGNGTITATYSANKFNAIRTATITVTPTGLTPQMVTVTQDASTVGLEEHALSNFQVYPNPSRGLVKLSVDGISDKPVTVAIVDLSGKNIMTGVYSGSGEYSFDLSTVPGGYYFVRISVDGNTTVRRVMLIN